ncbi:MAG: flagellar basal-body rod protein FlgG [Desulfosarcina sp.]|nr:flagellar basal-body rod protein FlgG [Desulfobacterales bacterium]
MIRSLWTAASGMKSQAANIDVISNNLANVNTSGFKHSRADFQDLLYETLRQAGTSSSESSDVPTGIQIGHGSRLVSSQKVFTQGDFQQTKNELDMAIEGNGFFQIIQPNGETAYTRDGTFKMDADGRIGTSDGIALEPEITVTTDSISLTIGIDGTVSVLQAGQSQPTQIGTITLARFVNPAGLHSIGRNLHIPTNASGDAIIATAGQDGLGTLAQGFIEMSNVSVVDEMVKMISAQRAYEINSKAIQAADEMLQQANSVKR